MSDTRKVLGLIIAATILQLAGGLTGMLTPLGLRAMGVDTVSIGVVAALHAAGFMAGAWTSPRVLAQFGNIRLFAAASATLAVSALLVSLWQAPIFWALVRVLQGVAFAYIFTSLEGWLNETVPARSRGNVMGVYHTTSKVAIMVGPFFATGLSALAPTAWSWSALFFALALVPVCLTTLAAPPPPDRRAMPLGQLAAIAPAAVVGVLASGVINTGLLAILPLYFGTFELAGGGTAAAALGAAAMWMGGLILQWPAGRLSDMIDRRLVVMGLAAMAGLSVLAIPAFDAALGEKGVLLLLTLWGAGALCFYGICVSHAIDRTPAGQVAQVTSGLLFVWAAGSIVGPILFGAAFRLTGPDGLFRLAGSLLLLLSAFMAWRVQIRAAPDHAVGENTTAGASALAGVEIHPPAADRPLGR